METRIWIAPPLCGCEISLTAQWVGPIDIDDRGREVSYRHPIPFTITELAIMSTCPAHDALRHADPTVDPWPDRPGYLRRPLVNPSEAALLYMGLWGENGQSQELDSCGCVIHYIQSETAGDIIVVHHPKHTIKCRHHRRDDAKHSAAFADNATLNALRAAIMADDQLAEDAVDDAGNPIRVVQPGKTVDAFFDDKRQLVVKVHGINTSERAALVKKYVKSHEARIA